MGQIEMPKQALSYEYKAFVEEVIDGDTIDVILDLGFKTFRRERLRFFGINAPESRTKEDKEKELGLKVKAFVKEKIEKQNITVRTIKQEKFGRYLCMVYYEGKCLNQELVDAGMCREYYGTKRTGWFNDLNVENAIPPTT